MIARDRTAIRRNDHSRPIRAALSDGIVSKETSVLDYGCGHGDDIRHLEQAGIRAFGWDPAHRPEGQRNGADVVNLGYVVNVVDDPREREDVLKSAWDFAHGVLIVTARLKSESDIEGFGEFQDGYVTRLRTFQKFYEQQELREWIESTLGEAPIAAAPGVFYVFRDPNKREQFIASRYRRRIASPRVRLSDTLFEDNQHLLQDLIGFVTDRGRLPELNEIASGHDLTGVFGSLRRAFRVVRRVTSSEQWELIEKERQTDLLVYLALGRFPKRLKSSILPKAIQLDIRAFFATYKRACETADALLFRTGHPEEINKSCVESSFGKLMPTALYAHVSGLSRLPALLRVFEGCARVLSGQIEGTTIVKLRRHEAKVSYLCYPDFDSDSHPALQLSVRVDLRSLHLKYRDFHDSQDPPILHRKELFVPVDYPERSSFAALTSAEEAAGLFCAPEQIGTRERWHGLLKERGLSVRDHTLRSSGEEAEIGKSV